MEYSTVAPSYTTSRLSANILAIFPSFSYFGAHQKDWAAYYAIYDNWAAKRNNEKLWWKFGPFSRTHEQFVEQNVIDSGRNKSYQSAVQRVHIRTDIENNHRETADFYQAASSLQEPGSTFTLDWTIEKLPLKQEQR